MGSASRECFQPVWTQYTLPNRAINDGITISLEDKIQNTAKGWVCIHFNCVGNIYVTLEQTNEKQVDTALQEKCR